MHPPDIRADLERAILAEIEGVGLVRLDRGAVVRKFMDRGVHRATLFRWIESVIKSGRPVQEATRKAQAKARAAEKAAKPKLPTAAKSAAKTAERMPARMSVDDVIMRPPGGGNVLDQMAEIMADVRLVVKHSKTEDGKVRNAKLLLAASANLRSCLEAATKMVQAMHSVDQVDHFHAVVMEEIAKASPAVAEAILARVGQVATRWGG